MLKFLEHLPSLPKHCDWFLEKLAGVDVPGGQSRQPASFRLSLYFPTGQASQIAVLDWVPGGHGPERYKKKMVTFQPMIQDRTQ